MKLFSEKLTRYKFYLIIVLIFVEIFSFIVLFRTYDRIYLNVFNQTTEIGTNKTLSITNNLNEIFKFNFIRYVEDLKFIGKHMSFLSDNIINNNSHYYQNIKNSQEKFIYYGTIEELTKYFYKYYDNQTGNFLYLKNYINDYIESDANHNILLKNLMDKRKHPELNSISYYKFNGTIDDIKNNEMKKMVANYLISILKTNFLKRFIFKGSELEILHYFLLTKDEIYIYPPDSYNNSIFNPITSIIGCKENIFECFYNYTLLNMTNSVSKEDLKRYIFPVIPFTYLDYQIVTNILCLNIPFEKKLNLEELSKNPLMCMEINTSKIYAKELFHVKENLDFLFFVNLDNDILPIYSDKSKIFDDIKKVFNDPKFGEYSLFSYKFNHFVLFHLLYIDLFNETSSLDKYGITLNAIFGEYKVIKDSILIEMEKFKNRQEDDKDHITLYINKTICKSSIYNNDNKCLNDTFTLIIYPLQSEFNLINTNFVEDSNKTAKQIIFYSMSILKNNHDYMKWKIKKITIIKIIKVLIFYFITSSMFIFLFFICINIFYEIKYNIINKMLDIIKEGSFFEIKDKNEIIKIKDENPIEPENKDMLKIKNLFDYFVKTILLTINFEQNEQNFNKKIALPQKLEINKNQINNKNTNNKNIFLNSNNNIYELNNYMDLINNINNNEIHLMFTFIIAYLHYKKGQYKLSENELKNLIVEINLYQNKISNLNENNDSKLKDSISRSSRISYLNEYSLTKELSEATLSMIKIKLLTQKIYYLYAFNIFNQEKLLLNNGKKYNKENVKKKIEEAIKYFNECKNISILLGTDTIRQIFSLIMISKCNNELKNYKDSMMNLNEALLLFSDLQKLFKDKPYFNPKIMMFTENYIFQNIMLAMAQTTFLFNKYPETCWILMKIIETSPFIFNSLHSQSCYLLFNCLNQIESTKVLPFRQIDKYKKRIYKMYSRINGKLFYKEKKINNDSKSNSNIFVSFPSTTNSQMNNLNFSFDNIGNSSNIKKLIKNKDISTNKMTVSISSLNYLSKNKNRYKNITFCISERLIQNIDEDEFKDVIIKYFKKCFSCGIEGDKFGFIQFSYNGKKTNSIRSDSLETFLQKLETSKMAFKITEDFTKNADSIQFMEFSNLFLSIIKSNRHFNIEDKNDNIILLFINTSGIRFNGQKECVDTINELNNNNYTVIIFTYDVEIDEEKIGGIYSFIYGLNDGHFFQIKNYQQIKQVFMNLSIKDSQEKFNNYNYEISDFML